MNDEHSPDHDLEHWYSLKKRKEAQQQPVADGNRLIFFSSGFDEHLACGNLPIEVLRKHS
jgi:hypothetical protein